MSTATLTVTQTITVASNGATATGAVTTPTSALSWTASDGATCISSVVFGFVLVLVALFALGIGIGMTVWLGSRARRRWIADSERIARERDSLRDKELRVHAEAVKHYMGELETYRHEGERNRIALQEMQSLLDNNGIAHKRYSMWDAGADKRASTMTGKAM